MGALDLLTRWLDLLASAAIGWRDLARARRTVTVAIEGGQLTLRGPDAVLATAPAGAKLPEAVLRTAGRGSVVLELPSDKVVGRRLSVPAKGRQYLAGIVQNQIERLSPWKVEQAAYGFAPVDAGEPGGALDVRVVIASRAALDAARRLAAEAGLLVDRIVAREAPDPALVPLPLWSRTAEAGADALKRARMAAGGAVAALVVASVGISAWALAAESTASAKSEALGARIKTLQRQALGSGKAAAGAATSAPERAWAWKEGSPATVVLLDAVSSALPETAYLTELNLQGTTLRLIGQASDAPSLIGLLEASGHLTDVRFFAPTTRSADGARFRFHIEARVQPRLELASR
jgi:general secretion pathway protein L